MSTPAPQNQTPQEKKAKAKASNTNWIIWTLAGLLVFLLGLNAVYFLGRRTPDHAAVGGNPPSNGIVIPASSEKEEVAPKPPAKVVEAEYLHTTEAEKLRAVVGWDSKKVPGYYVPLMKNPQGNPTPILSTSTEPYPLAPVGTEWSVVKYRIPTGKTYEVWATKVKPGT